MRYLRRAHGEPVVSIQHVVAACATAASVGVLFAPSLAHAETEAVAIHVETSGTCPSESAFLAKVRAYTTRWSAVRAGTTASRTIRVRLEDTPKQATGALAVESLRSAPSERVITGPDCETVSVALALMVAVAIDPHARTTPETDPEVARESEDASHEPEPAPEELPAEAPPSPTKDAKAPKVAASSASHAHGPVLSVDLRTEVTSAVVRGALFGAGLSLKIASPSTAHTSIVRWSPSVALGVRQSLPHDLDERGGHAQFLWTVGQVRGCPFDFAFGPAVTLSPCVEVNVGRLGASGENYANSRGASTFWLDLGGSLWASVDLSRRLFLGANVLLTAPFNRETFTLASGAPVSTAPAAGVLLGFGLGVKL